MFRSVGLLIIGFALCGSSCTKEVVKEAEEVNSELLIYVPIDPELTTHPQTIADGPLRDAPLVAKQRKKALVECYAQLDRIASVQGTEAHPITCPADSGKTPDTR